MDDSNKAPLSEDVNFEDDEGDHQQLSREVNSSTGAFCENNSAVQHNHLDKSQSPNTYGVSNVPRTLLFKRQRNGHLEVTFDSAQTIMIEPEDSNKIVHAKGVESQSPRSNDVPNNSQFITSQKLSNGSLKIVSAGIESVTFKVSRDFKKVTCNFSPF